MLETLASHYRISYYQLQNEKVIFMKDRDIKIILAFFCAVILVFYGALSTALRIFPYNILTSYLTVAEGVYSALDIENYNNEVRWTKPAINNTGVLIHDQNRMQPGMTLFTSTHDTTARLIDADGKIVHAWSFKFNDVWENQDHIIALQHLPDKYFYLRDFHLYDNGDLLLMVSASGVTTWGMGLIKLDKDSHVLWKLTGYPNNDFEIGPDGTIYVIEHKIRETNLETVKLPILPFLEDNILMLKPDGEVIKRVSLLDAIDRSPYKDLLKQIQEDEKGDPTHSNSLSYIKEDNPNVPWLRKGLIVISLRNISSFLVFDPQKDEVVYASTLPTRMQHDLDYLPNGHFMVFDNRGSVTEGGYTRDMEFDPVTGQIYWLYDPPVGKDGLEFESDFWGGQHRLANGNTLIIHAEAGRLLELTPEQDVVWEYRAPLLKTIDGVPHTSIITAAERIDPSRLGFLKQNEGQ